MQLKLQDDLCVLQVALVHVKVVLGYFLHIGSQASAADENLLKQIFTPAIPPYQCMQSSQPFHTGDCMGKDSVQIAHF